MTDQREPNSEDHRAPQAPEVPSVPSQGPQQPGDPDGPTQDQQQALAAAELKSARTLSTVAAIAGPVSLIIGGVALSTVALVCAIVGFVKVRRILNVADDAQKPYAAMVRQTLIWGLGISAVALAVNIVGMALMIPVLMEAMQTGDFSAILGEGATIATQPSGSGNAWG